MLLVRTVFSAVVALAAIVPSVAAAPAPGVIKRYEEPNLKKLKDLMPKSTLPAPNGQRLKFVGLGIGTQNYTCLEAPTKEPGTTGATAILYDIGTPLNGDPLAKWKIGTISGLALQFINNKMLLDIYLKMMRYERVLGDHFFTENKIPTFALNKVPTSPYPQLWLKKNDVADAPKSSCPGTKNEGAVPWLHLIDNGESHGGVNTVYRIETAGGKPPKTCQGMPKTFEVKYVAQYWVYGPGA